MLSALWLRRRCIGNGAVPRALLLLHAGFVGAVSAIVLLSPYLLLRLHPAKPVVVIAFVVGVVVIGLIVALVRWMGVSALRVVTLLPVLASLAFLLRVAAPALDQRLSARGVAQEVRRLEPAPAPVAVLRVDRELEYGLGFYLARPIARYERGERPAQDHVLISRVPVMSDPQQRIFLLGKFPGQQLLIYWVKRE
jgi:hypothetical protein